MTSTGHEHLVATVDGEPLLLSEIEARLAELRSGRLKAVLPPADTAEGRNMRRWVIQLCAAERIVRRDCARAGARPGRLAVGSALQVGGVAAAVLNRVPAALELVPAPEPTETDTRGYYERNRDLYPQPFDEVRPSIEAELAEHARVSAFARWLDRAMQYRVRLEPGFEHPAEPGHPDSTHRH